MVSNELIGLGAAEVARLIRSRELDPVELVDAHIRHIERVNPRINALVSPRFDEAREEARQLKERWSPATTVQSLPGVPVTVKDALPVEGLRFTAGSAFYRDNIATRDAEAVRRLKAAGAIVLGKTNCSEMSGSAETTNLVFGLTRNPWNLSHSAGGSSGGEAALIASGGSALGLGTDFGGSIRIPCAFCGVVGLKPTGGRIPTDGHFPQTPALLREWCTVGPIARRVEDVALALSSLSDVPGQDYRQISLSGRRVLVPQFLRFLPISRDVAATITDATRALSDVGMVAKVVAMPLMNVVLEYTAILFREWLPQFRLAVGAGGRVGIIKELVAHYRGKARVSIACATALAMFSVFGPTPRMLGYGRFEELQRLREAILASMEPGSVLLWPVFPSVAPRHGFAWNPYKAPNYTVTFNGLGFPAVAMPVGTSKQGLPLSVQVIGRPNEDETVLAVAATLEKSFGGWKRPPIASVEG
jgi:Asp-tRNA(Asn)/Glu-tRNA(Gln) amidotransferase A subunit family amidase